MLRAVSGVEPEAVQRRVLGEDVSTRGGDRLVGDGVRRVLIVQYAGRRSLGAHVGIHSLSNRGGMGGPLRGLPTRPPYGCGKLYSTWGSRDESASRKMMIGVDGWLRLADVCGRHMSNTQCDESITAEATLRGMLRFQFGIVEAANPLAEAARVVGYKDEYDMAMRLLAEHSVMSRPAAAAKVEKKPGKEGGETPEEARVPDDEFLLVLSAMLETNSGPVSGPDWYRELTKAFAMIDLTMTKGGFYARLKRLVARGAVKTSTAQVQKKLYGRDVLANVTLYSLPEETTPAKEGGAS